MGEWLTPSQVVLISSQNELDAISKLLLCFRWPLVTLPVTIAELFNTSPPEIDPAVAISDVTKNSSITAISAVTKSSSVAAVSDVTKNSTVAAISAVTVAPQCLWLTPSLVRQWLRGQAVSIVPLQGLQYATLKLVVWYFEEGGVVL